MTVRGDIVVDWQDDPRLITVLSPSTELTMQDLVDTARVLEGYLVNLTFEKLLDAAGKEPLGGGVLVGITVILNNAQIAFEARPGPTFVQCQITGGNVVAFDEFGADLDPVRPTAFTQVVRTASSSATLQESAAIRFGSFEGAVHIDIINGVSGEDYPNGTPRVPVDNLTDALAIAVANGFTALQIIGDITFDTGDTIDGYIVLGEGFTRSTITVNTGASVLNTEFYTATLTGTLDGDALIDHCLVQSITYVNGTIQHCLIEGPITLGGTAKARILDSWSEDPGASPPILDMGGTGQEAIIRNYAGEIRLQNKTGSEAVEIDLNSGHVILDADVTAGVITIRGVGQITDNSVGATVEHQWLVEGLRINELHRIQGLELGVPMVVNQSSRTAGDITLGVVGDARTEVTVTRS